MKEIRNIIAAYERACAEKKAAALATVVCVRGSAYRREGARMLVTEDGQLTGAISGGCLEGDALRKCLLAMATGRSMLITYDTTDDDAGLGLGLGCNGIIQILIEPLGAQANPVSLLKDIPNGRAAAVVVTRFSQDRQAAQCGTCMILRGSDKTIRPGYEAFVTPEIIDAAQQALASGKSCLQEADGQVVLYEVIRPPVSLVVVGAGNDAIPLAQIGHILGWTITIADGRPAYCSSARFPMADRLITGNPQACYDQLTIDAQTAVVLMTHNFHYDLELMAKLLPLPLPYIGLLGPRKKLHRMLDELAARGHSYTEAALGKVYGPTGLDLGARTPDEIALSIAAEIQQALAGSRATSLRARQIPIHA